MGLGVWVCYTCSPPSEPSLTKYRYARVLHRDKYCRNHVVLNPGFINLYNIYISTMRPRRFSLVLIPGLTNVKKVAVTNIVCKAFFLLSGSLSAAAQSTSMLNCLSLRIYYLVHGDLCPVNTESKREEHKLNYV